MTQAFLPTAPGKRRQTTTIPTNKFSFPQVSQPLDPGMRGIASITHKNKTFRFRTNPNQFSWTYSLNKHVDQTYGGRVVQLLSTKIDDFILEADCGRGRWEYANKIAKFLRDVMIEQRDGEPATFEYTTRGWKLNVFIVSMPFEDEITAVLRTFTIAMKVQEDVSGVMTKNSLQAELRRLQDGIGFQRNQYNDPRLSPQSSDSDKGFDPAAIMSNVTTAIQGYPTNGFLDTSWANPNSGVPGLNGLPSSPTAPGQGNPTAPG